ncbi:hypothetical protein OK074_6969, partial [Actinobacteria bacterium OK074]
PPPSPSPSPTTTCADGEVRIVGPLLNGVTQTVTGLLGGSDDTSTASPDPSSSPCIGLASLSLTGLLGLDSTASPSPSPEATP